MAVQRARGKLMSNDFNDELVLDSIKSNLMGLYMPQQGWIAEMSNRIIVNNKNTIIKWENCPKFFWVPAMEMTVYCQNRRTSKAIATVSTDFDVMSYELWHGQSPDIKHLPVWECTAYVIVPKERR